MRAQRTDLHVVLRERRLELLAILLIGHDPVHVHVRLRRDFKAVVAKLAHFAAEILQRHIAELAGADIDGSLHGKFLLIYHSS